MTRTRTSTVRQGWARAQRLLLCLLLGGFVCVWLEGARAEDCPVPKGIMTLAMIMEDARQGRIGPGGDHLERLEEGVRWWQSQDLSAEQLGLESAEESAVLDRLVEEAEALLRVSGNRDPRLFGPVLAQSSRILRRHCGQQALAPPKPPPERRAAVAQLEASELALGGVGGGTGAAGGPGDRGMVGSFVDAGRLALWLFAVIGLVVALIFAYRWAFSFVYNRRSCRIEAMIEFGLDVVDGTVTVLGVKGCRFVPVNAGARERIDDMNPDDAVFVIAGGIRREGEIRRFETGYVAIFFCDRLTRAEQAEMLALSSIRPQHVPKEPVWPYGAKSKPPQKRDPALRGPLYGVMSDEEITEMLGEEGAAPAREDNTEHNDDAQAALAQNGGANGEAQGGEEAEPGSSSRDDADTQEPAPQPAAPNAGADPQAPRAEA